MTWTVVCLVALIPMIGVVGVATLILCAAWLGHTDDSRADALDVIAALSDIGMSHKAASIEMRLTDEAELSKQLAGAKPLNLYRLSFLGSAFKAAFLRRQALRHGMALLTPEDLALIRGAAVLGPHRLAELLLERRPQKMSMPCGQQEQVA